MARPAVLDDTNGAPLRVRAGRVCVLAVLAACLSAPLAAAEYVWRLPAWASPPPVPADNPMTEAKVELGRRLFYDRKLAGPPYLACSNCHDPEKAFTDARPRAIGVTGQRLPRNTPGLANVAYQSVLTWADPGLTSLEAQALKPLFNEHPAEMGVRGFERTVLDRLRNDPIYPGLFRAAFGATNGRIDFDAVTKAIASFERTLLSFQSNYDRYRFGGERDALSAIARRGETLFFGPRLHCGACHAGLHLSDAIPEARFHNTGLYNLDGKGALPAGNQGLIAHTGRPADMGRFRTPMLRNIAQTAPYMHDGSLPGLAEVIAHYAAGGESARRERRSPLTSPLLQGFEISDAERRDLIAFLESLTDRQFLDNPAHHTPLR